MATESDLLKTFYESTLEIDKHQEVISRERRKLNKIEKHLLQNADRTRVYQETVGTTRYIGALVEQKMGIQVDGFRDELRQAVFTEEQIDTIDTIRNMKRRVLRVKVTKMEINERKRKIDDCDIEMVNGVPLLLSDSDDL